MSSIKKSLLYSLAQNYLVLVIQTAASMVLARLLTPSDIGKFSIAMALLATVHMLRDFGTGGYIVRAKALSRQDMKALFGINLLMAWGIAGILYASKQLIADFYHEQALERILAWMCLNFLIIPFSSIIFPLLKREMKFHLLLYIATVSTLASAAISIYFAYNGYGYMSLVWGSLANIAVSGLMAACFRPGYSLVLPSLRNSRHIVSFGGKSSLIAMTSQFSSSTVEIVMGKTLGFASVALYSKAETVINIFATQFLGSIRNVYYPAIAQQHRENKPLADGLNRSTVFVTAIAFPFYGFLILFVEEIVLLMFGEQWLQSAHIIQILALGGMFGSLKSLIFTILYTIKVDLVLKAEVFVLVFRVLATLPATLVSLELIAWAQVATEAVRFAVFFILIHRLIGLKFWPFFLRSVLGNGLLGILVTIPLIYVKYYLAPIVNQPLMLLAIAGGALLLSWVLLVIVSKHPFRKEMEIIFNDVMAAWR
ncbi:MAG: lipopolysaccharide biosynthesis protein [Methylovulum sp.]|nr:lipopolysaccharide biosynthesis protein [Methylovulum sp.]